MQSVHLSVHQVEAISGLTSSICEPETLRYTPRPIHLGVQSKSKPPWNLRPSSASRKPSATIPCPIHLGAQSKPKPPWDLHPSSASRKPCATTPRPIHLSEQSKLKHFGANVTHLLAVNLALPPHDLKRRRFTEHWYILHISSTKFGHNHNNHQAH